MCVTNGIRKATPAGFSAGAAQPTFGPYQATRLRITPLYPRSCVRTNNLASLTSTNTILYLILIMAAHLFEFLSCCCIRRGHNTRHFEKHLITDPSQYTAYKDRPSRAELADEIVSKLLVARNNDAILEADLESTIRAHGWYDGLATAVLAALENAIKLEKEMNPAMHTAYEKAVAGIKGVQEWAGEHPEMTAVLVTLIALGILAIMMPWFMAWLGFAEEGIIEGKLVA